MKKLSCKILGIFLMCGLMAVLPINAGAAKYDKKTASVNKNQGNKKEVCCSFKYDLESGNTASRFEKRVVMFKKIKDSLNAAGIKVEDALLWYQLITPGSPGTVVIGLDDESYRKKVEENLKQAAKSELSKKDFDEVKSSLGEFLTALKEGGKLKRKLNISLKNLKKLEFEKIKKISKKFQLSKFQFHNRSALEVLEEFMPKKKN